MQRESFESKIVEDMTLCTATPDFGNFDEFLLSNLLRSLDLGSLLEVLTAVEGRDEEKYEAISTWLQYNEVTEGSYEILELLATVQLNQLSGDFLRLQIGSDSPIAVNPKCRQVLCLHNCIF